MALLKLSLSPSYFGVLTNQRELNLSLILLQPIEINTNRHRWLFGCSLGNKENILADMLCFDSEENMSQAKILTSAELRRVLDHVATRPHAERNRAMVLCSHYGGMRVKEIAALRYCDVVNLDRKSVV